MNVLNIPFGNWISVVRAGISSSRRFMTVRMNFSGSRLTFRSDLNCNSNSCAGVNVFQRCANVSHTFRNFGKSLEVSVTVPNVPRVSLAFASADLLNFRTEKGESKFGYQQPSECNKIIY